MSALRSRSLTWRRRRRLWLATAIALGVAAVLHATGGVSAASIFLASAAVVTVLTPFAARLAHRLDVVVLPGGRAVHRHPTPLCGGVAICAVVLPFLAWRAANGGSQELALFVTVALVAVLGFVDDLRTVGPRRKLVVQALAGVILALGGWRLESVGFDAGLAVQLGDWGAVAIVVWVVCAANAFNLIDGMDGVCAVVSGLAALAALAWGADSVLPLVVAGACLGFLRHNLAPARAFLGDTGSLVLGVLVATMALRLPEARNLPLALALVAYPAGDTAFAIVRRAVRAKPLFVGDKSHTHHKLLVHLGRPGRALAVVAAFAAVHLAIAHRWPGLISLAASAILWVALVGCLVVAGRVRLGQMWSHRHSFRRIHALRSYVGALLDASSKPDDVRRALARMAVDLDLSDLEVSSLGVVHRSGQPRGPDEAREPVRIMLRLRRASATWSYAPPARPEPSLDAEMRSVVCELIRRAQARLYRLQRSVPVPRAAGRPPRPVSLGAGSSS